MARLFRLWEKKRGGRRTGSRLAGSVGEAIFFGVLFLLGASSLAEVITSQIVNPTPELMKPGFGFWLMVLVMASFVLLGGAGVVLTALQAGASVERRSALVKRATRIDLISDALPSTQEFPNVPRDTDLTNSPGVQLAYRLPSTQQSVWRLVLATVVALVLSAMTSIIAGVVISQHWRGEPDWFLTLFAIPLAAVTGWAIRHFFQGLAAETRFGPTCVEISAHPLLPDHQYEIFVSQAGRFSLPTFTVSLMCEEEATYSQGTDIRIEKRVVHEQEVLRREGIRIETGMPYESSGTFQIPRQAMHSFQAGHNAVRWKLLVRGTTDRGTSWTRSFPVVVCPAAPNSARE